MFTGFAVALIIKQGDSNSDVTVCFEHIILSMRF